jgi:hypothetical protein
MKLSGRTKPGDSSRQASDKSQWVVDDAVGVDKTIRPMKRSRNSLNGDNIPLESDQ